MLVPGSIAIFAPVVLGFGFGADVLAGALAGSLVVGATLSLLMASFAERRAYATVATLAVVLVGGAVAGLAEANFEGSIAELGSLADLSQVSLDTVNWVFGDDADSPRAGWMSALWVAGLTVVLAAWLVRRTRQLVRE